MNVTILTAASENAHTAAQKAQEKVNAWLVEYDNVAIDGLSTQAITTPHTIADGNGSRTTNLIVIYTTIIWRK